jgi:hypothetical protein
VFQVSEEIPVLEERRFTDYLGVTVNGDARPCSAWSADGDVFGPSPIFEGEARPFAGTQVDCGSAAAGSVVEIRIRDGFFDVPVWDYRGQTPPRWSFRAGENPDEAGPTDAVFSVMPGRGP